MFRRILLPTDFSDISWNAIVYAVRFFEKYECEFYLLHSTMITVSVMTNFTDRLAKTLRESAVRDLTKMKNKLSESSLNPRHEFRFIVSQEHIDDAIERAVIKNEIDLVIMATKGATGAKGIFFGSNTVRTIKSVRNCPVLIIPEDYTFKAPQDIAFPTDFMRYYDPKELKPLKRIAQVFNSQIRVLHINEEARLSDIQDYNRVELKKQLTPCEVRFHWMPDYAAKSKEINVFIESSYVDMLAMVRYKHGIIETIFNEPVIRKISFHPTVPFLVIPGHQEND